MAQQYDGVSWAARPDTEEVLAKWFARELGVRSVEVRSFSRPSETGMSSLTFLLTIGWREGSQELARRFAVRQEPIENPLFYRADLPRWARAQNAIAKAGVRAPRVWRIEEDVSLLGSRFLAMDFIEGRIPSDHPPYRVRGWVRDLAPSQRERLWRSALELLLEIHRLDWRTLELDSLRRASGPSELAAEIDYFEAYCDWSYQGRRSALVDRAVGWLRRNAPAAERLFVCWGDARPSNLVFANDAVFALDWELVSIGDPAKDVAWWLFSEYMFDELLGEAPLEGCLPGMQLVTAYEQASGARLPNLEYYQVFNALRALAIYERNISIRRTSGQVAAPGMGAGDNPVTRALERMLAEV